MINETLTMVNISYMYVRRKPNTFCFALFSLIIHTGMSHTYIPHVSFANLFASCAHCTVNLPSVLNKLAEKYKLCSSNQQCSIYINCIAREVALCRNYMQLTLNALLLCVNIYGQKKRNKHMPIQFLLFLFL